LSSAFFRLLVPTSGNDAVTAVIGGANYPRDRWGSRPIRPAAPEREHTIPLVRVRGMPHCPMDVGPYPWCVPDQDRSPTRRFAVSRPQAPTAGRSASGLVVPGTSSTSWMLDTGPVHELNAWLSNMARSYLIAREYLEPAEAARGRVFNRDDWITVLLGLHPEEAYVRQLAALNHAACHKPLVDAYQDRYPQQLPDVDAEAVRAALSGAIDGQPRVLLARQAVLRAIRLVLVPPEPGRAHDPGVATLLAGVSPETAAILLVHLAADALAQEIRATEPRG
jgi:hypothetical protein